MTEKFTSIRWSFNQSDNVVGSNREISPVSNPEESAQTTLSDDSHTVDEVTALTSLLLETTVYDLDTVTPREARTRLSKPIGSGSMASRHSTRDQIQLTTKYDVPITSSILNGFEYTKEIHLWNSQRFCPRPGFCKAGSDSEVISNFYTVKMPHEGIEVHQYHIEMFNQMRSGLRLLKKREKIRTIFWNVVNENSDIFGQGPNLSRLIFNDFNTLYVHGPLNMPRGQNTIKTKDGSRDVTIVIKMTKVKRADSNSCIQEERDLVVTLLDAILTQRVRCHLHDDSKHFSTHGHGVYLIPEIDWNSVDQNSDVLKYCVNLGKGLCSWIGLHGAVKINLQHEKLLYNVDINHSVYYKRGCNLVKFISEVCARGRDRRLDIDRITQCGINQHNRRTLEKFIKGLVVYSVHTGRVKKYRIGGVIDQNAESYIFSVEDVRNGRIHEMSVLQYFQEMYHLRLQFPYFPLIKIKKKLAMPMELLSVDMEPQKFTGQLSQEQLSIFIRETAVNPQDRKRIIEFLAGSAGSSVFQGGLMASDPYMKEFGVSIEQEMQSVECKFLPRPQLEFANHFIEGPKNGKWDLVNRDTGQLRKVLRPIPHPTAFQLIYVDDVANNEPSPSCFRMLMKTLVEFGLLISQHTPISFEKWNSPDGWPNGSSGPGEDKSDTPRIELEKLVGTFKQICNDYNPDIIPMVLFVMPRKAANTYALIKFICDCKLRVFCQVILLKTYKRMTERIAVNTIAHNMFLKISGKLGATYYRLKPDGSHKNWNRIVSKKELVLFIGVDVTHPGNEERQRQEGASIASVVGNIDVDAMQYRSSVRIQKTGQEVLVMITDEIANRIAEYKERTDLRPQHIVVYRDGISESDFKKTLYEEKKAIENAFKRFSADNTYHPTLTYIVASKRHHTRFFPKEVKDTSGTVYNLRPGLLVEKTITSREYFDFYLLSHAGPLGTSRPTHYYVLHDEWHPSAAFWQTITYALCFTYVRTPSSVSLPAPIYYAHLAAKKAAAYLKAYDYYNSDILKGMHEWEAFQKRTEAVNTFLDGMIFV